MCFKKVYIMRLSLINARDLQFKKITCFQLTPPAPCQDDWCIQTVPDPFLPTVIQKAVWPRETTTTTTTTTTPTTTHTRCYFG